MRAATPGVDDVPEISIVVVHGIGNQRPGETARAWAESSATFLTRSGTPARITDVVPPGLGEPPAFTVEVNPPGRVAAFPVARLRFVDGYWADAFVAPRVGQVVRWLAVVGPNLAVAQAVLGIRRREVPPGPAPARAVARAFHRWGLLARMLPVVFALASVALLAPLLAVVGALLVLVTLLPVPAITKAISGLVAVLTLGVGDVTTILRDDVSQKAMRARVRWAVEHQVRRAGGAAQVHVLAHSQGGAISHAVLAGLAPAERPARFTTVGAATGRLNDLRHLDPLPRWSAPATVSTTVAALSILPLTGIDARLVLAPLVWIAVVGAVQWTYWQHRFARDDAIPQIPILDGVDWLDLWAPFDLVPNGRPVAPESASGGAAGSGRYHSALVPGAMSVVFDHVTYDADLAETIPRFLAHVSGALPRIGELALRPGALDAGGAMLGAHRGLRARRALHDAAGLGSNWMPWEGRDWLSFALRAAAWVAGALVVIGGSGPVRAWGAWVRQNATIDALTAGAETWLTWASALLNPRSACCRDVTGQAGVAVVLVGALVLAVAAARVVRVFQRRALSRWLGSGLAARSEVQATWPLAVAVLAWCLLVAAAVVGFSSGPPGG